MKKRMFAALLAAALGISALYTNTYAMDNIEEEDYSKLVRIPVTISYDGTFTENVEFYVDGYKRSAFWYDASLPNNGYDGFLSVTPGEHGLVVLSSTDVSDIYEFEYPQTFDTTKDKEIPVRVVVSEQASDAAEGGENEDEMHENIPEFPPIVPAQYDFSDGKESGTIRIEAKSYGAVKTLMYRLVGAERTYDITLDRDHAFQADAILPVGEYYESSTMDIELADGAAARDDVSFAWVHKDNPTFFGNYYTVEKGGVVDIKDLIINMVQGSEQTELDSNILFSDTSVKNRVQAQQAHQQEELESAFPEIYGTTEAPTATIATAEPVEEKATFDFRSILVPAAVSVGIIGIAAGVIVIMRKRKK